MAAFNASKFVCSVMSLITLMISEISSDRSPSDLIFFEVACTDARMRCMPSSVSRTARLPCSAASSARRAASALASALFETCSLKPSVLRRRWRCLVIPGPVASRRPAFHRRPPECCWEHASLPWPPCGRAREPCEVVQHVVDGVVTFPRASLVTLPRCAKSPRATWLMTLSNSVMLRCNPSLASWLLVALETLATARIEVIRDVTEFIVRSDLGARARSPAAKRSENSARACTVRAARQNRHARITETPA